MNRHARELQRLCRSFVAGRQSFWEFHEEFLTRWTRLTQDALSEEERFG